MNIDMSFDLDDALTLPAELPKPPRSNGNNADVDRLVTVDDATAEKESCSVCMEGFGSGRVGKRVPCGHVYHRSCIADWSLRQNTCPLCRAKIFHD